MSSVVYLLGKALDEYGPLWCNRPRDRIDSRLNHLWKVKMQNRNPWDTSSCDIKIFHKGQNSCQWFWQRLIVPCAWKDSTWNDMWCWANSCACHSMHVGIQGIWDDVSGCHTCGCWSLVITDCWARWMLCSFLDSKLTWYWIFQDQQQSFL